MAADNSNQESRANSSPDVQAENLARGEKVTVKKKRKGSFWRSFVACLLIVFGCLFALLGTFAAWGRATVLTDAFVDTIAPLIQKEAVAKAISEEAVKALFQEADVAGEIKRSLPSDLDFIAEPVSTTLKTVTQYAAEEILKSSAFQSVWKNMLALAHSTAMEIIKGDGAVTTDKGQVVLDIGKLLEEVRKSLVDDGVEILKNVEIPKDAGKIVLFPSDKLEAVKEVVNLLDTLNWVLPLLAFIFLCLGVIIANSRRKALMGVGIGLAITMAIMLIAFSLAKSMLLGQLENETQLAAATVIWNGVLHNLVQIKLGILFLGILIALGAAVAGPYKWAVLIRGKTTELFKKWRERRRTGDKSKGPIGTFLAAHAWAFRIAGIVVALIVLLVLPTMSITALIITGAILVFYLVLIELLR